MRTPILLVLPLALLIAQPVACSEKFKDVPKDHWAAEYVLRVADTGVMKGYPDATFKGSKAVTRYELAVALERMIAYIEGSLKPEVGKQPEVSPSPQASPTKGEGVESRKSKVESQDAAERLKAGGYIAASSPLLTKKNGTVSPAELSEALASVAAKLIEKHVPEPKE